MTRNIGGKRLRSREDDGATWVDGRLNDRGFGVCGGLLCAGLGSNGRLDHDRVVFDSYGFGIARRAGAHTCCAGLGSAVGGRDGCRGCYSTGWLNAIDGWTASRCGVGD